ncbi:MAG: hypothetical protein IKZ99_00115 [Salinivirgaceae bacterium]|nr:hypothetical protein [Salinivirgaceae bacterium]
MGVKYLVEVIEEEPKKSGGCLGFLLVLVIVWLLGLPDGSIERDAKKQKTEQVSTQTAKKQSTTSTKKTGSSKATTNAKPTSSKSTTTSSSKPATTQSSNTQASSSSTPKSSSSVPASTTATSASASNATSNTDLTYEIYLSLSKILEGEGKSLRLCEAQNQTKGQEAIVIGKMTQLYGTKYYNRALKDIVRCCPKYASEYSKNGKYFTSESEFYQAYITPNYSKTLKAKKKENK